MEPRVLSRPGKSSPTELDPQLNCGLLKEDVLIWVESRLKFLKLYVESKIWVDVHRGIGSQGSLEEVVASASGAEVQPHVLTRSPWGLWRPGKR